MSKGTHPDLAVKLIVCGVPAIVELLAEDLFPGWRLELREFHYTDNSPHYGDLHHPDGRHVGVYFRMDFHVAVATEGAVVCAYPVDLTDGWCHRAGTIITVNLARNRKPLYPSVKSLRDLGVKPVTYSVQPYDL